MKMICKIVSAFTVFTFLCGCPKVVNSIKCYQCFLADINDNRKVKTCKDFDYSNSYIVGCPESTFCYKKVVKDYFYKTEYVRVERGCAQQLYRGQKFDYYLGWMAETYIVENAYENGCKTVKGPGLTGANVEKCYCDTYDLCNSSPKTAISGISTSFLILITLFIKWILF